MQTRLKLAGVVLGPLAILVLCLALAGWTGEGASHHGLDAILVFLEALPFTLAWLVAAMGYGWLLRIWFVPKVQESIALQVALGIGAMLVIVSVCGRSGCLQLGGSIGAWMVIGIGVALTFEQIRRRGIHRELDLTCCMPHWLTWAAVPAVAVVLLATTSAPGWLWDTEYAGYDVLSYHLQLPKEWMALGAITPVEHNVYSFFPGAMEAAFYHMMILRGDPIRAAYALQLLHAAMAIMAAWIAGRAVVRMVGASATPQAAMVFVLLIGTPWVIVAGSLAYNEMPVLLMLAGGLLVLAEKDMRAWRHGAVIGFFSGVACAAKLTAIGFVAAPLGVLLLMNVPVRRWGHTIPAAAIAFTLVSSPWLIHNAVVTGNPVFPFATSVFGTGHWEQEQARVWHDGHQSDLAISSRLVEGWNQLMRFGIGPTPEGEERWHAQWSILPWLTFIALAVLLIRSTTRTWGVRLLIVIGIQIVFWLTLTHIKSRFMLPMVVPGAIAVALALVQSRPPHADEGACATFRHRTRSLTVAALFCALLIWSAVPLYIFAKQAKGAPAARIGLAEHMTGEALRDAERESLGKSHSPAVYLNHLLPESSRVLFIGEAASFYYTGAYTYTTVWDRGPMSQLMREFPDEPVAWIAALREAGYTHVLFQPEMLRRWMDAGWNDPLLTPRRVLFTLMSQVELEHQWPAGEMLFRITSQ